VCVHLLACALNLSISSKHFIMRNVLRNAISDVTRPADKDGAAVPKHVATCSVNRLQV